MLEIPRKSRTVVSHALVAVSCPKNRARPVAGGAAGLCGRPGIEMLGAKRKRNWWPWLAAAGAVLLVVWVSVGDWGWLWQSR